MEILFRQSKSEKHYDFSVLDSLGINGCILKHISFETDRARITRKRHYHNGTEIHIIEKGYQIYDIDGKRISVSEGQLLLISPLTKHVVLEEAPSTAKYAIIFNLKENGTLGALTSEMSSYYVVRTPKSVTEGIRYIKGEIVRKSPLYHTVTAGRAWECILGIYRAVGIRDTENNGESDFEESHSFTIAKQYIEDNICQRISVPELASYCYISEKQLGRIFKTESGLTVMEYVRRKRCERIEKMLADPTLSLHSISEIMNFNNEYHFNSFFKKYAGMSPGAYRKAALKQ